MVAADKGVNQGVRGCIELGETLRDGGSRSYDIWVGNVCIDTKHW